MAIKEILEMDFAHIEHRVISFMLAKRTPVIQIPLMPFRKYEPDMQNIKPVKSEPDEPSGCLGYWSGFDPRDFDCEYEFSGSITCEECMFGVCGGKKDPRIDPDKEYI